MTTLSLDWETRSEAQLVGPKSVGLDNYVKHPSTRTLLLAYSWNDNQSDIGLVDFTRGERIPAEVRDGMTDPHVQKWAFNAQFEMTVARVLHRIAMMPEACRCTMALAHMRSFSGTLGQIGEQIGLPGYDTKDVQGKRLIKLFSEPQKITKANKHVWRDETTNPEDWKQFREYCRQDVRAEMAMKRWLIEQGCVADWEWRLWEIDQHINARGLPVDMDFVRNAYEMFEIRKWELRAALESITGMTAMSENVGSRAQLLAWLQRNGYPWNDLQKNTITRALDEHKSGVYPLNEAVAAALRVRQQLGRTAPTKYAAIMRRASADSRLRYCFQFGGAARTTRWSGRGPQPQNLVRPPKEYDNIEVMNVVAGVIAEGDYTGLQLWAGEPMNALAGLVRCAFTASQAKQLCVSDIKSVESVGVGFVARCERMLDVFRKGRDAYIDFAKDVYGIRYEDVTPEQRKIIKPAVLGCFAPETLVLTDHGWIELGKVTLRHLVHDGVEFVGHGGIADQGEKETIDMMGVGVTPDHLVLTAEGWKKAECLNRNTQIASRAIDLAVGLLSGWSGERAASDTMSAVANAALNAHFTDSIFNRESQVLASRAQTDIAANRTGRSTSRSTFLARLSTGSRTATTRLLAVVGRALIPDTAVAGSFADFGMSTILFHMSLHCRGLKNQIWKLIEKITTETTAKAICGLPRAPKMCATQGAPIKLRTTANFYAQKTFGENTRLVTRAVARLRGKFAKAGPRSRSSLVKIRCEGRIRRVYDIWDAGPRHRFVILTNAGPLIVHNCGYGLAGGYVLPDGKKTGLLGYAAGMGVMLTPEVAQRHVELWRATYPEVPQTWYDIEKAMHLTIQDQRPRTVNGLLTFRIEGQFLTMEIPTGRRIWYYKPRVEQRQYVSKRTGNPYTQNVMTCMGMVKDKHFWSRIEMRGNLVFENAIQAMCRDIHGNGMILAHDEGFSLVGMVHDELIAEEDIGSNYYTSELLRDCVRAETRFPRLKGMPLDASHFSTIRYRKD